MLWHLVEHTQCVHWTRPERAYCSRAPEPTRQPHGLGSLCSTTPRAPLLAATRQAAPAAPGRPSASRRRPAASAHVGAAKASHARHLAPGTARAHPRVCPLALVAATMPYCYRTTVRRPPLSTAAEPTSSRYKRTPRNLPSTQATLKQSPRTPWGSKSTRGGHLPHLRQQRPPPWPQLFQRHQGLSLPFLFTKNTSFLPGTQPPT